MSSAGALCGLLLILLVGCGSTVDILDSQTDAEIFEQGQQYYEQGDYKKSLQYFLYIKDHFLRSSYAGITRFYAGESYFALKKYEDAAIEYKSFLSFFPNDPYAPAAQYKLGASYLKKSLGPDRDQTMLQNAITTLQEVQQKYPDNQEYVQKAAEEIQKVKQKLALHEYLVAEFYRKEERYISSNHRLQYLLEQFPEARISGDGLYMLGQNYLDLDQPEEAKKPLLQLVQQYPNHEHVSEARKSLAKLGVTDIPQAAPLLQRTETPATEQPSSLPAQPTQKVHSEGYIVLIRENTVFTDLIRTDGIREGMNLEVYREEKLIGTIRIVEIHEGFSIAEIESLTSGMMIQEEDTVIVP